MNKILAIAVVVIAVASFSALGMSIVNASNSNQEKIGSIPGVIAYQGYLVDDRGAPISDGRHTLEFTMYDSATGGKEVWSESQDTFTSNGAFSAMLGSNKPLSEKLFINQSELHLGIAIDNGKEASPRQRLASVPFAIVANTASVASDLDCTGCVTSAHLSDDARNSGGSTSSTTLTSPDGRFTVRVTNSGIFLEGPDFDYNVSLTDDSIKLGEAEGRVLIKNGDLVLDAKDDIVAQTIAGKIKLQAAQELDLQGGTKVDLIAGTDLDIESGFSLDINGGSSTDVTSGGTTKIDGAIIMLHDDLPCKGASGIGDGVVGAGAGTIVGGNVTVLICN